MSPDAAVATRLFTKLLTDYLNELGYPAELAGLHYAISNSMTGFQVSFFCCCWGGGRLTKYVEEQVH